MSRSSQAAEGQELEASLRGTLPDRTVSAIADVLTELTPEEIAQLQYRADHDALTGLPNRDKFRRTVQATLHPDTPRECGLIFLDLDRFKEVNDAYGHLIGDQVLLHTANRLLSHVRDDDLVARLGGDEFVIVCPISDVDVLRGLAQRICTSLARPVEIDGRHMSVGASAGIAIAHAESSVDSLIREADRALYESKSRGRNQVVVFDDVARAMVSVRDSDAIELREAINDELLEIAYQPVIDLSTGRCVGIEALSRWKHPERGAISPDVFIPMAEEHGLIAELGALVLGGTRRDIALWGEKSTAPIPELAVNISTAQFTHPAFLDVVVDALNPSGPNRPALCLEVTETALIQDVDRAVSLLESIRALGIRVAIDDFGTGYSSLSYLRRYPIDIVKIDRSFVSALGSDTASEAIIAAIVNLSHALGFEVVAEGIETEQQLAAVTALGADRGQGFLWCRPGPLDDIIAWVENRGDEPGHVEHLAIGALLQSIVDSRREASDRAILLQIESRSTDAVANSLALQRIVDLLITNALKFSPPDKPVVVTATADRRWIRISITDYGIGMNRDEMARCFEQFWKSDRHDRPGVGIGLFEARSLVESIGGHVGVRSARNRGTTFTVAVPRHTNDRGSRRKAWTSPSADSSIREFMRQIGVPNRGGA